ncbi:MAG: homoserine O-succinyltransferase [Oscillospiraceae bacterium]|jgi:homoserine O-succinyltransferase|nr:homoserine O-succinyltransferase [Oscillospiraceae bacterium]
MPIKIQDGLPAQEILENENIFVMTEHRASHQDIRPLRLLILNLMPTKVVTETQLLRKLSNTPLQIEVEFLQVASHTTKNTSAEHLETFYTTFDAVKSRFFDGMIITGAPVELLDFEDVDYWPELCDIMDWSARNVHCTLHICWGAQAGLYHHYNIGKRELPKKLSGVFENRVLKPTSPFFRGFDDTFTAPHSRYTEAVAGDILDRAELEVLSDSPLAGVFAVKSTDSRRFFIMGHPEYDADTLSLEYFRDVKAGLNPEIPQNYFENDDPSRPPRVTWRSHAQLMYTNWLNYYVYQSTPFDIEKIAEESGEPPEPSLDFGAGI